MKDVLGCLAALALVSALWLAACSSAGFGFELGRALAHALV